MIPGSIILLFTFLAAGEAYNTTCGDPPFIDHGSIIHGKLDSGLYPEGHQIIYGCEDSMGYRMVACEKQDNMDISWTQPDRDCTSQPVFCRGTGAGVFMAVFNYVIGLTAIWYSTRRHKKKLVKDAIMEAADMMPVL